MKLGLISLACVAVVVACASNPCPASPPRAGAACPQSSDAGLDANGPFPPTCAGACMNMRAHDCQLGKMTPNGTSCEAVCENVQRENWGAGFNAACLSKAKSCVEADACR